jgi:peptidoglycan hydrolase CwlO-like protein
MPSAHTHSRPFSRTVAVACAVLVACLAVGARSDAQTAELDEVRAQQDDVRAQLQEQNTAVDALIGEVSALRVREDKVAAELAEQEAELADARAELADARAAFAATKRQLGAALNELKKMIVSAYRYGEIDEMTVLLNADGLDELATTSTYLERIEDYQAGVVVRVRDLREAARSYVDTMEGAVERMEAARDAIAERQEALAVSRAALEAREAELEAAQAERREQLEELQGEERSLERALATPPAPPPTADASVPPAPAPDVAPGSAATINSDGTATAPANAPEAVKGAIAAANAISDMPYLWGGGHGSFESSGYDCSGSVSYALHGGGLLSSPLDSTGFMTWGESGPGNWITVYSSPGHAYIVIAGLRFDTSGGAGPRWQGPRDPAGFVATHPPGY